MVAAGPVEEIPDVAPNWRAVLGVYLRLHRCLHLHYILHHRPPLARQRYDRVVGASQSRADRLVVDASYSRDSAVQNHRCGQSDLTNR